MYNSLYGLEMGKRAMDYFRRSIETAGHNISNANTEGFSRQRVEASTVTPLKFGDGTGTLGQGAQISSIVRIRDAFLDAQYRDQLGSLGTWNAMLDAVNMLEMYVGEPVLKGFQYSMNAYWSNLEELQKYPESMPIREAVVQSAKTMVDYLAQLRGNYDAYRTALNDQIRTQVTTANGLIDEIAELNKEIAMIQAVGDNPNDLLDKRDLLADKLCKLTGATVGSPSIDEADGDFKIYLGGICLVQGPSIAYDPATCGHPRITNTHHLVAVMEPGNSGFFSVQIENNLYNSISDTSVATATIEQGAPAGVHDLFVERLADQLYWTVGGGENRKRDIYSPSQVLGISGTFGLQVGSAGVVRTTNDFSQKSPPGAVVLQPTTPQDLTQYRFRVAAGDFESLISATYSGGVWTIEDNLGNASAMSADGNLTIADIQKFLDDTYGVSGTNQLSTTLSDSGGTFTIKASNTEEMRGHLLSITDIQGDIAGRLGLLNSSPSVEITVTESDSLQTIANKINSAYKSPLVSGDDAAYTTNPPGTAPDSPEEWLHASVEQLPDGSYYLVLTSNVAGEEPRINVLSGDVCGTGAGGSLYVAELLGLTETNVQGGNRTSYIQVNYDNGTYEEDVYVNDAYFILDGKHYLSSSNELSKARQFDPSASVSLADTLAVVSKGIHLQLQGINHYFDAVGNIDPKAQAVTITVRHPVAEGTIAGMLQARDDLILDFTNRLDELVYSLVTETNAVHYAGYGIGDSIDTTGVAFFDPISILAGASKRFSVNSTVANDVTLVAAAGGDGKGYSLGCGDGSNAMRMAQLKQSDVLSGKSMNFNEFYEQFLADLGSAGQRAAAMAENQLQLLEQIDSQRQSVMGVNLDEEMMNIIRFQQSLNAMARYMTAIDDMLDRIINGMGTGGR